MCRPDDFPPYERPSWRNPTFDEITQLTGIPRCRGISPTGHACVNYDHRRGQIGHGQVHWADRRRVEPAGVRRFLKLGALLKLQSEPRPWARLYLAQKLIDGWSRDIRMSFPATGRAHDRLEVKAMLINVPTDEPLRQEAMDWAQTR